MFNLFGKFGTNLAQYLTININININNNITVAISSPKDTSILYTLNIIYLDVCGPRGQDLDCSVLPVARSRRRERQIRKVKVTGVAGPIPPSRTPTHAARTLTLLILPVATGNIAMTTSTSLQMNCCGASSLHFHPCWRILTLQPYPWRVAESFSLVGGQS